MKVAFSRYRLEVVLRFMNLSRLLIICCLFSFISCSTNQPQKLDQAAINRSLNVLIDRYGTYSNAACDAFLQNTLDHLLPTHKINFEIVILATKEPIALSAGANKILISLGLLQILSRESEAAFMLAHEIAHYLLKHFERINTLDNDQLLSFQSELEFEADKLALNLVANAGYDPVAAVTALTSVYRSVRDRKSLGS